MKDIEKVTGSQASILSDLSTFIYADARKGGLTPELRPLSTIIFVLVLVMLIIINRRKTVK